jgi:acyl carrier protein
VEQKIKQIMADVLDLDAKSIDEATGKDQTASWDSLNHINLVLALEQEFQVSFDVNEIESMLSYKDILEVLDRKLQH